MTRFDPDCAAGDAGRSGAGVRADSGAGADHQSSRFFPLYTEDGKWQHGREAWTNWCEGFLGGMMWIFAARTGDQYWRERAEHYSLLIEERQHDTSVHDLGSSSGRPGSGGSTRPAMKRSRRG